MRTCELGGRIFLNWLDRDEVYSPQSYRQLAKLLQSVGYTDLAVGILYDGRERDRRETDLSEMKWWFLSVLKIMIGYGYGWRYFIAVIWLIGLTAIGVVALGFSEDGKQWGLLERVWYSADMVIPVIRLREKHYRS